MPRRKKVTEPVVEMARVIRDPRDGSQDYFIPRTRARELFDEGKLHVDMTNSKEFEVVYGADGVRIV
jgi:hypothetical protein